MPKVTVLMPAYNCAGFLSGSVQSILDQTYKDFELLVIDNASSDNTGEVIGSFKDPRIIYHRIEERGIGNALNYGLKAASSDIIVRMDADDISLPDRIEKQLDFFLDKKEECIVSCRYGVFESAGKENVLKFVVNVNTCHDLIRQRLALHSELIHAGMIYNRKTITNAGGYGNNVFEDYELLLKLKDKIKFYNVNETLLLVRYRRSSISRDNIEEKNKIIYNIQDPYYKNTLSKEFGIAPEDEDKIRGWREFFFGDKDKSRPFWNNYGISLIFKPGILAAYMLSFMPEKFLLEFKEKRIRFRLSYLLDYFSSRNRQLRNFKIN